MIGMRKIRLFAAKGQRGVAPKETRMPNSEGRKKVETRNPNQPKRLPLLRTRTWASAFRISALGIRISFGLRPSGFGFPLGRSGFGFPALLHHPQLGPAQI